MRAIIITLFAILLTLGCCQKIAAQELDARIVINRMKVEQTSDAIFESLQTQLTEFMNNRQWTSMQFRRNERIQCVFTITVNEYDPTNNTFNCTLNLVVTRPVYNSSYTTTLFSTQDNTFSFTYQEFDKLDFRADVIDNELTALMAYYAYLIIGYDCDAMAPLGGTEAFNMARTIVNNAQSLSGKGWKAFDNSKNRYAIINDLLDGGMEPFRQMIYSYYRHGLDVMAENADRGRAGITEALEMLKVTHENKPLSQLPMLFTEYKYDELVNIYKGKGTSREKEPIIDLLLSINASKNAFWQEMR